VNVLYLYGNPERAGILARVIEEWESGRKKKEKKTRATGRQKRSERGTGFMGSPLHHF
jgi:hypothetical protein